MISLMVLVVAAHQQSPGSTVGVPATARIVVVDHVVVVTVLHAPLGAGVVCISLQAAQGVVTKNSRIQVEV